MFRASSIVLALVGFGFPSQGMAQSGATPSLLNKVGRTPSSDRNQAGITDEGVRATVFQQAATVGSSIGDSREQLQPNRERRSRSESIGTPRAALPEIAASDAVSDVVRHWLARAAAERVLAIALADLSAKRVVQLESLHASGHAGWVELTTARCDAVCDAARSTGAERFATWLRNECEAHPTDLWKDDHSREGIVPRLELTLPGSRAVLGWVRPDRLIGDECQKVLELLLRRSALLAESDDETTAARRRLGVWEERAKHLSRLANAERVESDAVKSQLMVASARIALAEATRRQLQADHEMLKSAIESLKSSRRDVRGMDPGQPGSIADLHEARRTEAASVRRQAIQVLVLESQAGGELEITRAAVQMARLRNSGFESLFDRQQNSTHEWKQAQSELQRSRFGWEQLREMKVWTIQWEHQLFHEVPTDGVRFVSTTPHDVDEPAIDSTETDCADPVHPLTKAQRRDVTRTRKAISLARQWWDAGVDVEVEKAKLNCRSETVSRLKSQQAPNEHEIAVATAAMAMSNGRLRRATERMKLIRLLWQQELANDVDEQIAFDLTLIGVIEARAILDSAAGRIVREDSSTWIERVAVAERRVEGLKQLRETGYASDGELAQARNSLAELQEEQAASSRRRQLAELERELAERLLALRPFPFTDGELPSDPVIQKASSRPGQ